MKHTFVKSAGGAGLMADINMTNLIDVTLTLLIIFILLAPVIEQGISVDLPRTQSKPKFENAKPVVITIKPNKLYYQDQEITDKVLDTRLTVLYASDPEQQFIIRAERSLPYEAVVTVMDKIQKTGFRKLALATQTQ